MAALENDYVDSGPFCNQCYGLPHDVKVVNVVERECCSTLGDWGKWRL